MLKDVDGYPLTGSLDKKIIVKVGTFSYIQYYLKPTKRGFDPSIFVPPIGTNNLSTNDSPKMIADKTVITVESLKAEENNFVSWVVLTYDKLNEKAEKVNKLLEKACSRKPCNRKQIDLIKHTNINTMRHLNRSRLHSNGCRKSIFIRNIKINKIEVTETTGFFSLNNTLLDNNLLKIKEQRLDYSITNVFGHLNINSVRKKFDSLIEMIKKINSK